MGVMENIFGGTIRKEMKHRVDQVLVAGEEWRKAAQELTSVLNRLVVAIESQKVEPGTLKDIVKETKNLSKKTDLLSGTFEKYVRTMQSLATKLKAEP